MKILFFGDIVGQPGRQAIKKIIPIWQKKYAPDFIIANGENAAHGKGMTNLTYQEIIGAGVDLITSGDHIWSKNEVNQLFENPDISLIRPANYPPTNAGRGYKIIALRTKKVLVINLLGRIFMKVCPDDPIRVADQIIDEVGDQADAIIVDFHAEVTSEKVSMGWYLDGKVTAVIGTHTHIPTADARILPQGTGYITDAGMVGVKDSSLGADKEAAIKSLIKQSRFQYEIASGPVWVNAVLLEINKGRTTKIELLLETVD